ncbi:MAG: hypothetical protein OXI96_06955, partial [Acidimicrobiaceae bacterium]|nr:hypothetical protein [Acidimicrobiaceae bacterium]
SPTSVANPPIEVSKRPWISDGCDGCTPTHYEELDGTNRRWWREHLTGSDITQSEYNTRTTAWSNYDWYTNSINVCNGDSLCEAGVAPVYSMPSYPQPYRVPRGITCTSSPNGYDTASPGAAITSVSYTWPPDPPGISCSVSGASTSEGLGSETHDEYHVWNSWSPPLPTPYPPVDPPRSYPHGIPRDSTTAYTPAPTDPLDPTKRLDPGAGTPPTDTADNGHCIKWGPWVVKPARKAWQPIDFSNSSNPIYDFSITGSTNIGAPYRGPNTHMQSVAADSTNAANYKAGDLNHMSPDVPAATINLTGGWASGVSPPSHWLSDPLDPYDTESHPRSSSADHGPDSLGPYGSASVPPRGAFNENEFHPDYKPNTNNLDNSPLTLVTKLTLPLIIPPTEHIGYASDHWPRYVMVDPAPLHELCDFMGFKLANVAILAPAGGLIADQWFLPRQTGNNPTIEIQGSITVKHRGLFARSDTNGNLTTGYRKHFTHPTDFEQGTTTWWPDIKQNHWTPQP